MRKPHPTYMHACTHTRGWSRAMRAHTRGIWRGAHAIWPILTTSGTSVKIGHMRCQSGIDQALGRLPLDFFRMDRIVL